MIRAIPTVYRGTRFASTLEADWARTFDELDWYWEYEPEGVEIDGTRYRPDFYLPAQRIWCEVKGPLDQRRHLPSALQRSLLAAEPFEWRWSADLVVVLRPPGPGDAAVWDAATCDGQDIVLIRCPECQHYGFMDFNGEWTCRRHFNVGPVPRRFWMDDGGEIHWPGDVRFRRCTRAPRGAA